MVRTGFHCVFGLTVLASLVEAAAQNSAISALPDWEFQELRELYVELHRNPELSFEERRTSRRLAGLLRKAGYDVTENVGGYGVVAVMRNGGGPTVLARADMDALPVKEETGLEYASTATTKDEYGRDVHVMHACGHDIHMTCLIGAARTLAAVRDQWKGTLVLILQPAEERGAGAKAMLEDGLFERFPRPDYALALHVDAGLEAGKIGYTKGYAMANVDSVDIRVFGVGGHGAYPHLTRDPVVLSAQIIMALQTIVSREISPLDPAVITIGSIHGGAKHNVIPDDVELLLTVRSYSDETRAYLLSGIERVAKNAARTAGLPEDKLPVVTVRDEYTPALYNTPELVDRAVAAIGKTLGAENLVEQEPVMGGEDFGRYGRVEPKIPIFMFRLGAVSNGRMEQSLRGEGEPLPSLHSSKFAPDPDPTIKTGIIAMTAAVLDLFDTAHNGN